MSISDDQELLNSLVGDKVLNIEIMDSNYRDGYSSHVVFIIGDKSVSITSSSFNDGSSYLNFDVTYNVGRT